MENDSTEVAATEAKVIQVPQYFYAVDINYLTHMIGNSTPCAHDLVQAAKVDADDVTAFFLFLADMLGRLISHNDLIPLTSRNLTRFHSRTPPSISLHDYLRRIVKYACVEKACLLVLLIYIDRVCELHPEFTISSLTVHRFLITAVTVSSKALCDSYCTNTHYAKVGGISTHELNALELELLKLIDWNLTSSGPTLQQYYANLVHQHPCYKRCRSASENNPHLPSLPLRRGKRRRSSTLAELANAALIESQQNGSRVQEDNDDGDEEDDDDNQDDGDEQETIRHFEKLLTDDDIPYIA